MLHVEQPLMCNQVMLDGWTCMTGGHATKNAHELFFGDLVIHM